MQGLKIETRRRDSKGLRSCCWRCLQKALGIFWPVHMDVDGGGTKAAESCWGTGGKQLQKGTELPSAMRAFLQEGAAPAEVWGKRVGKIPNQTSQTKKNPKKTPQTNNNEIKQEKPTKNNKGPGRGRDSCISTATIRQIFGNGQEKPCQFPIPRWISESKHSFLKDVLNQCHALSPFLALLKEPFLLAHFKNRTGHFFTNWTLKLFHHIVIYKDKHFKLSPGLSLTYITKKLKWSQDLTCWLNPLSYHRPPTLHDQGTLCNP